MKKFAVVGDSEAAKLHTKNIARVGKLVAVCGDDESETIAREHGAKAYRVFDEMLAAEKEADVVAVCSPVGHHAEHIIKSLQAGKDVLCESPLCLTKAAAWQIIETEKYCGRRVYLIQASKFNALLNIEEFKEQVDKNIYSFDLRLTAELPLAFFSGSSGKRFPGGGLLYTAFAPFIELLLSFFDEIETVEGFTTNDYKENPDDVERYGVAALKMKSGVIGSLHWLDLPMVHGRMSKLTLFTESGEAATEFNETVFLPLYESNPLKNTNTETLTSTIYKNVYDDLLKALSGEEVDFPTTLDGSKTVETIEKIYNALR